MNEFAGVVFAIVQAVNAQSGLLTVNITGVPDKAACEQILVGATEGAQVDHVMLERASCVTELPGDYIEAIKGRPIPDTMIVAVEISHSDRSWRVRIIHSGVAESYQSQAGCDLIAGSYRHVSQAVRCVNGYR